MIILCAFEMSAVVAYITRFTEENFALLIATIYVYKAVEKLIHIAQEYPMNPPGPKLNATDCYCIPSNDTIAAARDLMSDTDGALHWVGQPTENCTQV